ncbi:MAG: RHS repeat-associated core domain-containing protein [Acidiferrobacterales bacterium]
MTERFVSSDPIWLRGGLNTYQYAYANPLTFIDPMGLSGYSGSPAMPSVGPYGPPVPPEVGAGQNNYASQAGMAGGLR